MKICDKLKSIFKSSPKNQVNDPTTTVFGNITKKELVTLSVEEFKNRCEKEKKKNDTKNFFIEQRKN